jgi:hypothetical protein
MANLFRLIGNVVRMLTRSERLPKQVEQPQFAAARRNSVRLSLPVAVFGSAFTNSISRGYL